MAKRKGALAKDPPLRGQARRDARAKARGDAPAQQQTKTRQGNKQNNNQEITFKHEQNQAAYNAMTPQQQARYRRLLANKGRKAANEFLGKASNMPVTMPGQKPAPAAPTGPANEPPPGTPLEQLTPEQQGQEMGDVGADVFIGMGEKARQFDPATMQQNYEMQFGQERERYTQNLMDQFERRNQRQFEQQRLATQQQIAERGLDPASPAAQELMRQQNEREDMARQEAMSQAVQGSYGVQAQAFGQAKEQGLMYGQIAGQFMEPAMLGYQQAGAMNLAEQQAAATMEQQRLEGRQRLQQIRATPRGGSGGGGGAPQMSPFEILERNSLMQGEQPQINPIAAGAQGLVQGATGQITGNLNRR